MKTAAGAAAFGFAMLRDDGLERVRAAVAPCGTGFPALWDRLPAGQMIGRCGIYNDDSNLTVRNCILWCGLAGRVFLVGPRPRLENKST